MTSMQMEPPPCSPLGFFSIPLASACSADLHAGRIRFAVLRGDKCRHLGFPQRHRLARHVACCCRRRRHDAGNRSNRFRHDPVSDFVCPHCGRVRFAGDTCWPSRCSCHGANRSAFVCLAGRLCLPRAVFIGGTAWTRLIVFAETRPLELGRAVSDGPRPVLTPVTREG
jgi:hypothetical protein